MISIEDRYSRIDESSHVVFIDDKTIHEIESLISLDNMVLIETVDGLLFNDMDVFTIEEMVEVENKIGELIENI